MDDNYKKRHKPQRNSKYKQGYFHPQHPEKWVTKTNEYRSSWEFFFYGLVGQKLTSDKSRF